MKKTIALILISLFFIGCSTSNDGNGNSTTTAIPVTPSNLVGNVVTNSKIKLSWTDNSTNETGFKIERKTGAGNYTVIATVNADIISYSDLGLTPNTTYTYRVYSYNTTGNSPTYSNEVTLTTTLTSITDIDGNTYQLTTISNQTFTTKNLEVTHYRNGDIIPQVTDATTWNNLTTGAWCYYQFQTAIGPVYGKCYNWYAVTDPRGLAPEGFHIPSNNEWDYLSNCLGYTTAGKKLKEAGNAHWPFVSGISATNSSGFTALPMEPQASFVQFWSTSTYTSPSNYTSGYYFGLSGGNDACFISNTVSFGLNSAAYVRCIMD
ncbi:fibrobacter succinogenes major paralogous domain-containing protein [Flavobacterium aciduliphilum]|uniref:Uncharacterized protein (TIGR02145 family) n=1 Tax=Flavobacterium aciduliphilum TaxID=1101402 RepID=A0A328YGT1_9FLAO|nr:FISUMP domain-containing protein [Flavobacterium aciduliphilum]RAR72504.1 uncharacterized protein (TIGR02145 family) [Flavobacterium aciduliphilum]